MLLTFNNADELNHNIVTTAQVFFTFDTLCDDHYSFYNEFGHRYHPIFSTQTRLPLRLTEVNATCPNCFQCAYQNNRTADKCKD